MGDVNCLDRIWSSVLRFDLWSLLCEKLYSALTCNFITVFQEFVENSRKSMKEAGRGGGAEGRELKPMVGADEEVAILQEFHFYFFSLFVFTDCTSSGEVFVLCITQDVLLFLFVSLPITWMAEFLSQLRPSPVKVRWKELSHMKQMQYHFIRISGACHVVYADSPSCWIV